MTYEIEIHLDPGLGAWASYDREPFRATLWSSGMCSIEIWVQGGHVSVWASPSEPHPIDRVITWYLAAAAAMGLDKRTREEWWALFDQMLTALRAANEDATAAQEASK
jgi:hypothetical protein